LPSQPSAQFLGGRQKGSRNRFGGDLREAVVDLGTQTSLDLQRLMTARRYREVFPHINLPA
jgi:hypothetical protein